MADIKKLNDQDLDSIAGGVGGTGLAAGSVSGTGIAYDGVSGTGLTSWKWVAANVRTGYLALRSAPSKDYRRYGISGQARRNQRRLCLRSL